MIGEVDVLCKSWRQLVRFVGYDTIMAHVGFAVTSIIETDEDLAKRAMDAEFIDSLQSRLESVAYTCWTDRETILSSILPIRMKNIWKIKQACISAP